MDRQQAIDALVGTGRFNAAAAERVVGGLFDGGVSVNDLTIVWLQQNADKVGVDASGALTDTNSMNRFLDAPLEALGTSSDPATQQQAANQSPSAPADKQATDVKQAVADATKKVAEAKPEDLPAAIAAAQEALSKVGGGAIQQVPRSVFETVGHDLNDAETARAIQAYNALNPRDPISTKAELYLRAEANYPAAMEAIGRGAEGADNGQAHFNIWNPQTAKVEKQGIDLAQTQASYQVHPAAISQMGSIVGASKRTGDEVPWQLVLFGAKLAYEEPDTSKQSAQGGLEEALGRVTGVNHGVDNVANDLKANLRKFGDRTLALIALKDPNLAQAIYDQGAATPDQALKAMDILNAAGYSPAAAQAVGLAFDTAKYNAIVAPGSGAGGGGATLPDPATLRETATKMYQAWFSREPTEDELNRFVGEIDAKVVSATKQQSNPFKSGGSLAGDLTQPGAPDAGSDLAGSLRSTDEYRSLFGNKPIGTTEEDYAAQFRNAGARMLGGAIPDAESVRVGQMTGNPEDTLRYLSGKASSLDNSSFQQRLQQAANAIAQVT